MPSPKGLAAPWSTTLSESTDIIHAMAENGTELPGEKEPSDEELISQYFDMDGASGESENFGRLDEEIPGFKPIQKREDNESTLELEQCTHKENFSGGCCGYVFPWSSQTMMGDMTPQALREYTLEIYTTLGRKRKPTLEDSEAVKRRKMEENPFPSAAGGIIWNDLYREVFRPKGNDALGN